MFGVGVGIRVGGSTPVGGATPYVGLLDTYPNAAAAYSVRLLRSAYSGSAIRVRRSSDNAEQDIGFVSGNLDTSSLTSFCGGTNGFVTTWYDQSGNGYDVTQTTAANQPQIVSSGSIINVNSKPSLQFTKSANQNLVNGSISVSGNLSFETVNTINYPISTWSYVFMFGNFAATGGYGFSPYMYRTQLDWQSADFALFGNGYNTGVSPRFISQGVQYSSGVQSTTLGILSTTNSKVYKNNSLVSARTYSTGSIPTQSGMYIGSNQYNEALPGTIQELIVWQTDQNSNTSGINTNINTYYAIY